MDILAIWTAGRLTHSPPDTLRYAVAAIVSALLSVVMTVDGIGRPWCFVISAILALIMCIMAFGVRSIPILLRTYLVLWLCGIILGGIMTFLMSAGTMDTYSAALRAKSSPISIIPAGALLLIIAARALISVPKTQSSELVITFRGNSVKTTAICDTGNLLEEPVSGQTVVILNKQSAQTLFSEDELKYLTGNVWVVPATLERRINLVPAHGISGETLIRAVRVDALKVGGNFRRALLAVSDDIGKGTFGAVISPKLL